MTMHDSEGGGRGGLRDHLPTHRAPPLLHDRVRATLDARGSGARRSPWLRRAGLAAAAAVVFAAGVATGEGALRSPAPNAPPGTQPAPKYALLLYGGDETPNEPQGARAAEYGRWAAGLTEGRFVSGEELGRLVGALGAGAKPEPAAGFFLIDAADDAAAMRVARDCPHLKYGGRVVVQALPRAG